MHEENVYFMQKNSANKCKHIKRIVPHFLFLCIFLIYGIQSAIDILECQ